MAGVSATSSMVPKDVPPLDASMVPTSDLSVASTAIMHKTAQIDPQKIVTPLIPAAWHSCLENLKLLHMFSNVPVGLTQGFQLGASWALSSTSTLPNHKSAHDSPSIIDSHTSKELVLGCYSDPFLHTSLFNLIGHFCSALLGLVSKPSSPGEFRMVQDFSFSHSEGQNNPVNSEINVEEFPCIWGLFDNVVQALLDLPEGSSAATFDVDTAYQCIPIHPDNQPSTIVSWHNQLYIDHCAPFGAASSNGLFAQCSNVMLMILKASLGCCIVKWVDDYVIIRPPHDLPGGNTVEQDIYNVALLLGWPWKSTKTKPFASSFIFLGSKWLIPAQEVSILPKKQHRFLNKIAVWLNADRVLLKSTQQLIGSLVHCTNVVCNGREWLAGLIHFSTTFPHAHCFCFIVCAKPALATQDTLWWQAKLSANVCCCTISPPPLAYPHKFFMDVSMSFGIATSVDNHWAAWQLMQGWRSNSCNIGWAKILALEMTLESAIAYSICNLLLHFCLDNQDIIFAMAASRLHNLEQNNAIKCIFACSAQFGLHINTSHIASDENPADPLSCGVPIHTMPHCLWSTPIPAHLAALLAFTLLSL
ncbi:Reverse transcriptase (RNA-dependent DNA polymerase) domain-containing protein [Rhizoctonia solani]|uniref:Reverse transcriptase (RNA-dependent DNA polymerase) domain-containing protein n=1 Tax=Rhizoctonia solani TaxID=456999 RepID=A0A8H8NUL2_9AGAM|nr:Reverse transcriptase (RNA-dependent DNA polymerase) domain-containing protein [Rhizoctonia solani]QRW19825.1 Reverse transcriptase (RNA-dependent DNA polymerase) domain-containing protein [Rhizoctonia solani]